MTPAPCACVAGQSTFLFLCVILVAKTEQRNVEAFKHTHELVQNRSGRNWLPRKCSLLEMQPPDRVDGVSTALVSTSLCSRTASRTAVADFKMADQRRWVRQWGQWGTGWPHPPADFNGGSLWWRCCCCCCCFFFLFSLFHSSLFTHSPPFIPPSSSFHPPFSVCTVCTVCITTMGHATPLQSEHPLFYQF